MKRDNLEIPPTPAGWPVSRTHHCQRAADYSVRLGKAVLRATFIFAIAYSFGWLLLHGVARW